MPSRSMYGRTRMSALLLAPSSGFSEPSRIVNMMSADSVLIFASLWPTSMSATRSASAFSSAVDQRRGTPLTTMLPPPPGPICLGDQEVHEVLDLQHRAVREIDARLQRQPPVVDDEPAPSSAPIR